MRTRTKIAIVAVAAVAVFAGTSTVLLGVFGNVGPAKDTGVAACQSFADKAKSGKQESTSKITADEYHQLRDVFAHSRYGDLRDAGTKFVDVVWQLSQLGDDAGFAALGFIGPLMSDYASLTGACANHGVTLPPLTGGTPTTTTAAYHGQHTACSPVLYWRVRDTRTGRVFIMASGDMTQGMFTAYGGPYELVAPVCGRARRIVA